MELKCDRCHKVLDDNTVWHGGKHFCGNVCYLVYVRRWYDPLREITEQLKEISELEETSCPRCDGLGSIHNLGQDFKCRLCLGSGRVTPAEAWAFIHEPPDPIPDT